jgi:hypothetical protein
MINMWLLLAKQWFNRSKANFSVTALGKVFGEGLITPWIFASKIYRSESVQLLFVGNAKRQNV